MAKDTGNVARGMAAAPLTSSLGDKIKEVLLRPDEGGTQEGEKELPPLSTIFGKPKFKMLVAKEYANDDGSKSLKVASVSVPFLGAGIDMVCHINKITKRERDAEGEYDDIFLTASMPAAGRSRFSPTAIEPTDGDGQASLEAWRTYMCQEYQVFARQLGTGSKAMAAGSRSGVSYKQRIATA